ncbi:MAG: metallophosphoesterase [Bacteroidota bacterium]|nr:metallophosphoesterase [Bacteroidota bacterium]
MILENDNRYLAPKYRFFSNYFGWNYSMFFTRNSFFGKWLRAHNSVVKINDDLFLHGGISYGFYQQKMSIEDINKEVRYKLDNYLVNDKDPLFSMSGPFWYRGYLWTSTEFKKITEEELDEVLAFYQVKHIIVGHTISEQIQSVYNNKVIALSASFCEPGERIYGLLIRNGNYFRVSGKEQKKLF